MPNCCLQFCMQQVPHCETSLWDDIMYSAVWLLEISSFSPLSMVSKVIASHQPWTDLINVEPDHHRLQWNQKLCVTITWKVNNSFLKATTPDVHEGDQQTPVSPADTTRPVPCAVVSHSRFKVTYSVPIKGWISQASKHQTCYKFQEFTFLGRQVIRIIYSTIKQLLMGFKPALYGNTLPIYAILNGEFLSITALKHP